MKQPCRPYASNQIEFAWTALPVLIVFVLVLTTIRTIYDVQAAAEPPGAIHVRVIGRQWWWEFHYPDFGIVTANELHVPLSDAGHPVPAWLQLESAGVAHSFWIPRLAGKTDVIPNRINTMCGRLGRSGGRMLGAVELRALRGHSTDYWILSILLASVGSTAMAINLIATVIQSLFAGAAAGRDPWDAWTLERLTDSPPPEYNFADIPTVHCRRPLWDMKHPHDPDWKYE